MSIKILIKENTYFNWRIKVVEISLSVDFPSIYRVAIIDGETNITEKWLNVVTFALY